jgi:hypothetical protein
VGALRPVGLLRTDSFGRLSTAVLATSLLASCTLSGLDELAAGRTPPQDEIDGGIDSGIDMPDDDAGNPEPEPDGGGPQDMDSSMPDSYVPPPPPPEACKQIATEMDYIASSAWTEARWTYEATPAKGQAAYGAINDWRITADPGAVSTTNGAESVHVGTAALAAIGLMEGMKVLEETENCPQLNREAYRQVVDAFFQDYLPRLIPAFAPVEGDAGTGDGGVPEPFTAFPAELKYNHAGAQVSATGTASAAATAQVVIAMTRYVELPDTDTYRNYYLDMATEILDTLVDQIDDTTKLVTGPAGASVEDNAFAAVALRNTALWARSLGRTGLGLSYDRHAAAIEEALQTFKDTTDNQENFLRLRTAGGPAGYAGTLDLSGIAPYYSEAVTLAESFAPDVSTFWTDGTAWTTKLTNTTAGDYYYGTKRRVIEASANADEQRLFASAGLRLARVEWNLSKITRDPAHEQRARDRFNFVREVSGLWYGAGEGTSEGGIAGGILEWKSELNGEFAPTKRRFVDTSADFIALVAMVDLGRKVSFQSSLSGELKIEAEDYDAFNAVGREGCMGEPETPCTNIMEVGNGDWVAFNNFAFDGVRAFQVRGALDTNMGFVTDFEFRKNSPNRGAGFEANLVATCTVTKTGGWQSWKTFTCDTNENAVGNGTLYVVAMSDPFNEAAATRFLANVNWIKTVSSFTREAELFDDMDGLTNSRACFEFPPKEHCKPESTHPPSEEDYKLGWAGDDDWVQYAGINFSGVSRIKVRYASGSLPSTLEFHKGSVTGPLLGACQTGTTGDSTNGWAQWATSYCPAVELTGVDDLFIVWKGAHPDLELADLTWFTLQ